MNEKRGKTAEPAAGAGESRIRRVAASTAAGLLVGMLVLIDHLTAMSVHPYYTFVSLGVGLSIGVVAFRWRHTAVRPAGIVLLLGLIVLPWIPTTPVKPFRQFYYDLHTGMGEREVEGSLAKRFPASGSYPRPLSRRVGDQWFFVLDPRDGRYDAETIALELRESGVVTKQYLPD